MPNHTGTPASAPAPSVDSVPPASPASIVPFFRRNNKSKSSIRKRPATPPPAPVSDSDNSSNSDDDEQTRAPRRIKRQKKSGISDASTITGRGGRGADDEIIPSGFSAKSKTIISTNDATASTTYHNENEFEYLARKSRKSPSPSSDLPNIGTYKGTSSYSSFIKRSENAPQKQTGPLKAPTNVRTITVTDFAPDVCKDYKQTGFCGFGDSCKFLHAREDYAQGWQLDRDWEIKKKNPNAKTHYKTLENAANPLRPKEGETEGDEVDKELEKIPFACVICKKEYKKPIVTKCGHYFCEECAIGRYRKKNPSCAICGGRTDGVFNTAKGLQKKLDEKKRRSDLKEKEEAERKRLEEEAGPVIQGGW
ncbi:hypothetical protein EV426DRAFT_700850 [Tirmania nivea]|nr:hypothetical protein EV426DRAFT_700850 [Tirmania nivea]